MTAPLRTLFPPTTQRDPASLILDAYRRMTPEYEPRRLYNALRKGDHRTLNNS